MAVTVAVVVRVRKYEGTLTRGVHTLSLQHPEHRERREELLFLRCKLRQHGDVRTGVEPALVLPPGQQLPQHILRPLRVVARRLDYHLL